MSRSSLPPLEDEFTRALLGSAESDGPSPTAYAKAASALGVGAGVGASLPAAAVVGAAGAAGIARWSSSLSAKLLFGISGALVVGVGALVLRNEPAKPRQLPTAVHAPAVALAAGVGKAAAPNHSSLSPSSNGESLRARSATAAQASSLGTRSGVLGSVASKVPTQGQTSTAVRSSAATPAARRAQHAAAAGAAAPAPARASIDSSLAEQVQSLDRARVALTSGDSSSALGEIARYRAAWPNGFFLTEASVLEIEALAARGERSRAQARAAEFVAAHPDSPQADRLRALIPKKKP